MSDLISRKKALQDAQTIRRNLQMLDNTQTADKMLHGLRLLESVIEKLPPEPRWIPCSERLPGKDGSFYVLCCDKYGEIMIGYVFECDDGETPYSAESEHEYMYDCVAWMPLPEPWKEEK